MTASWQAFIEQQQQLPYFDAIEQAVVAARAAGKTVFPPQKDVFNAFTSTPLTATKVVILGQDPYHSSKQAHGLSFSVLPGVKTPPSLANMYKELATDINGFTIPDHGYLQPWAEQGVLLLNTVLTVEQGNAHSHAKIGWETFTDRAIEYINDNTEGVIFLTLGGTCSEKR